MVLLFLVAILAVLQGVFSILDGLKAARHLRNFRPVSNRRPRVAVFCPCKGLDPGFRANVQSILAQDYPHFRAVFVVEDASDPAAAVLGELGASVLVAGAASNRGQKVHNLLHGLDHGAGDAEVFVFCDSDARFPPTWIGDLVAPLDGKDVAVSTGFRWYAETSSGAALARSVWNASVVTQLGGHSRNFAWGGSMALRRGVFESLDIRGAWDGAASDDFAVTRAARAAGLRIVFVPRCLVPSYGDCTWGELLEFTTRQMIITRVYDPGMWRTAFVSQTIFAAAFWCSLFLMWPAALALFALAGIKSYIRCRAVAEVLPHEALSGKQASYILLVPLIALLYEYNLIRSALTRNIVWRQIHYRLISPTRTAVRRGVEES